MKWLQEKLTPNLGSKSVIVVDNESYHNVQFKGHPNSNTRKGEILLWVDKRGTQYRSDMKKAELYNIIKVHKPQYETFAIDRLLANHRHRVLRLPPYHPALNPIEKIWGMVKTRIAAKDVTFKQQDVQQQAEENLAALTMEEWAAVCRHAKDVEEKYMSREHKMACLMERITINADDNDDDDIQEVGPMVSQRE